MSVDAALESSLKDNQDSLFSFSHTLNSNESTAENVHDANIQFWRGEFQYPTVGKPLLLEYQ